MGMTDIFYNLQMRGAVRLDILEDKEIVNTWEGHNILCSTGMGYLVQAINWSGITDVNSGLGAPFTTATLAPVLGTLGNLYQATPLNTTASIASGAVLTQIVVDASVSLNINDVLTLDAGGIAPETILVTGTVTNDVTIPVSFTTAASHAAGADVAYVTTLDDALYGPLSPTTTIAAGSYAQGVGTATWTWVFFFGTTTVDWTIAEAGIFLNSDGVTGDLLNHVIIAPQITKTAAQTASLQTTFSLVNT